MLSTYHHQAKQYQVINIPGEVKIYLVYFSYLMLRIIILHCSQRKIKSKEIIFTRKDSSGKEIPFTELWNSYALRFPCYLDSVSRWYYQWRNTRVSPVNIQLTKVLFLIFKIHYFYQYLIWKELFFIHFTKTANF